LLFLDDDVRPSATLLGAYSAAITPEISVYEGRTTCVEGLRSPLDVAPVNETGGWLWSCNMMVRRRFWESTGGFDEDFRFAHMEDVAFRHRLNQSGEQFLFVAGAAVNHPPRRRTSFKARIPIHESHFIYYYKYLGRSPSRGQLVIEGLRGTLETIRTRPKSIDSVVALGSVCLELCGILRRWSAWDHKYRVLAKAGPMSPSTID
jgi:GT2 family glycosyltransferase